MKEEKVLKSVSIKHYEQCYVKGRKFLKMVVFLSKIVFLIGYF